jgi:hypothetical protein
VGSNLESLNVAEAECVPVHEGSMCTGFIGSMNPSDSRPQLGERLRIFLAALPRHAEWSLSAICFRDIDATHRLVAEDWLGKWAMNETRSTCCYARR